MSDKYNGWEVEVMKGGNIIIHRKIGDNYGFHPHDFTIEDRMAMIRALSMTKEESSREILGDSYIEEI
jgi:hypothetical protein